MKYLDELLGRVTMYRLLVYYLLGLLAVAMAYGAVGLVPYSPMAVAAAAGYLALICWAANKVFARVYRVPTNPESPLITALILALIITPPGDVAGYGFLTAAAGLAVASKYMLAIRGKHVFNPAAVAVALTALVAGQSASWWVGTTALAPWVAVGGVLLVRKIERGQMTVYFLLAALASTVFFSVLSGGNLLEVVPATILHSSLLFLAFVMLTEPLTSPATVGRQRWYGGLVGLLLAPQIHLGSVYSTPELALLVGNIYSYVVSPKVKLLLKLTKKVPWGSSVTDFIFTPAKLLTYQPGQYMEWTLPHLHPDSRGSRRYFTLASSPTEPELRVGVKFYENGSTYKRALKALPGTTVIAAGQLGGDFTLPADPTRKLAFIAGGIGVTPFRSMIKYLHDTGDRRPVTLVYAERTAADLAYTDVFAAAHQAVGTKLIYALNEATALPAGMHHGRVTAELITTHIPDYAERLFYISGPHSMVVAVRSSLRQLGVKERNIKVDYFPGYA